MGRLYRTSDLARFEANGSVDFLGRIGTQVKIRGFRVELAEIESLLLQWPVIRNAAVALKEGPNGVKKLIAYLMLDPNHLLNYPFWSSVGVGTGALLELVFGFSLLTALRKWVLIGRYRPLEKPLWSFYVWRNELINSLCKGYVFPLWVTPLLGTSFATWFFQLMGSHFGHSVYLDTTEITEFDLAWVADHAILNNGVTIQTHLFEDRIMKMSDLRLGRAATVGTSSVVLHDSVVGPGNTLKSLSLFMKGEKLPANTRWQGIPSAFISAH